MRVLKNGKPQNNTVETGLSSGTEVEIISGLSEGDVVVISTNSSTFQTQQGNRSTSVFGGGMGGGMRMR